VSARAANHRVADVCIVCRVREQAAASDALVPVDNSLLTHHNYCTGDEYYEYSGSGELVFPDGSKDAVFEEWTADLVDLGGGVTLGSGFKVGFAMRRPASQVACCRRKGGRGASARCLR
jgi:hypothetical protein